MMSFFWRSEPAKIAGPICSFHNTNGTILRADGKDRPERVLIQPRAHLRMDRDDMRTVLELSMLPPLLRHRQQARSCMFQVSFLASEFF
jgi:hypothetical protein